MKDSRRRLTPMAIPARPTPIHHPASTDVISVARRGYLTLSRPTLDSGGPRSSYDSAGVAGISYGELATAPHDKVKGKCVLGPFL
jgi:hypothetical protein